MTRLPELDALRLLVAVAHGGSIGAAARVIGTTQQAASERLRSMEAQVGLPLVRRGARGSDLTPSGAVVVEWATQLLDLADEIDVALEGLRGDRRRELTVWSSMTVSETLLPRWLVLLRGRQEAEGRRPTSVSIQAANSDSVIATVIDGAADLGFVEGVGAPAGVRSREVLADELVLVAAPGTPLARRRTPLEPDEVAALATTSREAGSGTRQVVAHALARHHLGEAEPAVELSTAIAVREAVLAGSAPAFLSRRVVGRELSAGSLVEVPLAGLDLRRSFRAVWVGGTIPPAGPVRELIEVARTSNDERGPR